MRPGLRRIGAVATKEWRETTRDPLFLSLAFLLPVLWMVVFGYGLVLDVEDIPFAVVDRDRSDVSRDYVFRFVVSKQFRFQGYLDRDDDADALLQRSTIRMALIIPEHFQQQLLAGRMVHVQTLLDGSFPLNADITKGYVIGANHAFTQDILGGYRRRTDTWRHVARRDAMEPITLEVRYLYNQEVRSTWSMVPALIMSALMFASPLLTALGVVREKEHGSIYNIYCSTVSRWEFLVGKLAPYVGIAAVNAILLWVMATVLFGVPFKGSFLFFVVTALLFVLCSTGIGLLVSLLVQTQMAALIITIVLGTIPTIMFSGLLVPVSSLGRVAQIQAHLFPAMYYTNILRGSFLKGVGFEVLWRDVLALGIYAVVLLVMGYQLFTKRPRA